MMRLSFSVQSFLRKILSVILLVSFTGFNSFAENNDDDPDTCPDGEEWATTDQRLDANHNVIGTKRKCVEKKKANSKLGKEIEAATEDEKIMAELRANDQKLAEALDKAKADAIERSNGWENSDCKLRTEEASKVCDPENRTAVGTIGNVADQLLTMGETMTASTPALACSNMGKILMAASGASLGYKAACTVKYVSCSSACSAAMKNQESVITNLKNQAKTASLVGGVVFEDVLKTEKELQSEIRKAQNECANNNKRLQAAVGNVTVLIRQAMAAKQCQKESLTAMEQFCKENPTSPVCGGSESIDCSNPTTRATNTVCICQTNPTDSRCGNSDLYASSNNRNGNSADNISGVPPGTMNITDSGGMGGDDEIPQARPPPSPGGMLGHGGGGGGGGRLSGDGGGKGKGGGGGYGSEPPNTKISGGFWGGGSSGSSNGPGRGYGNENANPNGLDGSQQKGLDLSRFLPKGKLDPTRGLASATGPDGITGPNTSIWEKIKTRYFVLTPGLRP